MSASRTVLTTGRWELTACLTWANHSLSCWQKHLTLGCIVPLTMLFLLYLRSKSNHKLPIVIFHQDLHSHQASMYLSMVNIKHLPVYGELSEVEGLPGDIPRVLAGLLHLLLLFARAEETEARQWNLRRLTKIDFSLSWQINHLAAHLLAALADTSQLDC